MAKFVQGGFSGWSHAAAACQKEGITTCCKFAVELEQERNVHHLAKHGIKPGLSQGYSGYAFHFEEFQSGKCFPLFQEDVELGWWISCISRERPDAVCVSPPCPPYSMAASGKGLGCNEGLGDVVKYPWPLHIWIPKIILLENVAAILMHEHWDLIRLVIESMGLYHRCQNTPSMHPKFLHRIGTGCLLILAQNDEALNRDVPMVFSKTSGIFIDDIWSDHDGSSRLVGGSDDWWQGSCHLFGWEIPPQTTWIQKIENGCGRISHKDAIRKLFGCIMATYTFQHELPKDMLAKKGLFGNLLQHGQVCEIHELHGGAWCLCILRRNCFLPKRSQNSHEDHWKTAFALHMPCSCCRQGLSWPSQICVPNPHMTWSLKLSPIDCVPSIRKLVACDEGWWLMRIEDEYEWETMRGNSHHDSIISPTLRDE